MSIPGSASPLLLASTAAAAGGYQIERSLRFNSADSAYLSRTPASAGNRKTWTWAGWVKRSALGGTYDHLFGITTGANDASFLILTFGSNGIADTLGFQGWSTVYRASSQVFRDASAWCHIVLAVDTTQSTAANRIKLYVNGVEITTFSTNNNPGLNDDLLINSTATHNIGRDTQQSTNFNGYLADIHFIDGQALTPSSFTEVSATTGQLIPKAYAGTYTGNSFWLKFNDNSAATATTLGKDSFLLGNNWTPNNLSVTAGAGNDSLVDTPTSYGTDTSGVGGVVRGNYATLNALDKATTSTLADGNLQASSGNAWSMVRSTIGVSSGKWYWECNIVSGNNNLNVGIAKNAAALSNIVGGDANGWGYVSTGLKWTNGSGSVYGASFTAGDVMGIAFDADNGTLTFYKNNTTQGQAFSGLTNGPYFPALATESTTAWINHGQRAFAYTAPSGFKALCDTNLPEGTITTSGTYTGNGVADGPFVYLNGVPTAMTVGGNAVTFGTHADKLSNGFKLRTTSTTYNQNALSYSYSITTTGAKFKFARAQPNP